MAPMITKNVSIRVPYAIAFLAFPLSKGNTFLSFAQASTPLFVKQLGAAYSDPVDGIAGASLKIPEEAIDLLKRRLKHRSGADMDEWPEDLKIREWPDLPVGNEES